MVLRSVFFLLFILIFGKISHSQMWGDSTIKNGSIFHSTEEPPKFPGGTKAFYSFIADNLAKPLHLTNEIVHIRTIINKEGSIVYAEIEKGSENSCNLAALDLMKKMPKWNPARQNGRPVPCYQIIHIMFLN